MNWPSDEMRACGGRSSWRDWTPKVGMVGYVVHYWQPNHPDVFFRSNVNRTLLLLQIGNNFVPVGEAGVKEYHSPGSEVRGQTVSAENLSRRGRGSNRSRKFSDSIRRLKSEEDPVLPAVVVLAEEEVRAESGKEEEGEKEQEMIKSPDIIVTESVGNSEIKEDEGIEEDKKDEVTTVVMDPLQVMALDQMDVNVSPTSSVNIDEELARVRE